MDYKFTAPIDEEFIEMAIAEYQAAFETVAEAAARSFKRKIHEIREKIDTTKVQIVENKIKGVTVFESNFAIISKMMLDLGKMFDAATGLEERINAEKQKAGTVRGEKKVSYLEKRQEEMDKIKNRNKSTPIDEDPGF